MPRVPPIFAIVTLAATLGACTQAPPQTAALSQPFYVPATLILQSPDNRPTPIAFASPLAFQVLPASNFEDVFVPRGEKFAYGSTPIAEVSAYSIFIYDAQRISSPRGTGFRYTWAVREGIAFP